MKNEALTVQNSRLKGVITMKHLVTTQQETPTAALTTADQPQALTAQLANVGKLQEDFLAERVVSDGSLATYERALRQFFVWLDAEAVAFGALERRDIIRYMKALELKLAEKTAANYLTVVRLFFTWAASKNFCKNIAAGVKSPRGIKKKFSKEPLSTEKSKELLTHFKESGLRDFAMVNLMLRTGLRTIEVRRLNVGDIKWKSGKCILMVQGKGRSEKDDFVVLRDKAYFPVKEYLATREAEPTPKDPLFTSFSHKTLNKSLEAQRISTRGIRHIVKEGLKTIGLDAKQFSAHSLRHTTAVTIILSEGGTYEHAQEVLRHKSVDTTKIYTAFAKDQKRLDDSGERFLDNAF